MNGRQYSIGKNQILANWLTSLRRDELAEREAARNRSHERVMAMRNRPNPAHLAGIQLGQEMARQKLASIQEASNIGRIKAMSEMLEGVEGLGAGRQRGSGYRNALLAQGVNLGGGRGFGRSRYDRRDRRDALAALKAINTVG